MVGEHMMPGMPRVPGFNDAIKMMQTQTELLAELPATIAELQRAVRGLGETLNTSRDAAASAARVSSRVEEALDEIEDPIRALRPGLERLAVALDSPVIDRIPATLEAIEATVLPIAAGVEQARERWAAVKERGRRLLAPLRSRGR
jgi:chromosome segregation ATPase